MKICPVCGQPIGITRGKYFSGYINGQPYVKVIVCKKCITGPNVYQSRGKMRYENRDCTVFNGRQRAG